MTRQMCCLSIRRASGIAHAILFWGCAFGPMVSTSLSLADSHEIPLLKIQRTGGHIEMQTSLPPGRHSIKQTGYRADDKATGFIYTTASDGDKSIVRIFQLQNDIGSKIVSLRMRASTTIGYYTLFIEISKAEDGTKRSAILRRNCCGYQLEIQDDHFKGRTFDANNLMSLEKSFPEAFASLLSIASECAIPQILVDFSEIEVPKDTAQIPHNMGG